MNIVNSACLYNKSCHKKSELKTLKPFKLSNVSMWPLNETPSYKYEIFMCFSSNEISSKYIHDIYKPARYLSKCHLYI